MTRRDWAIVLVLVLLAIGMRSFFLAGPLLEGDIVRLQGMDAWYQLRVAMNLEANYPRPPIYDPYLIATRTAEVPVAPALPFLAASAARLSGNDSAESLARIAAWIPPILGGAAVFLIYLLGFRLNGRYAALAAAVLLVFLPGQAFKRTSLGFFDQHGLEVVIQLALALVLATLLRESPNGDRDLSGFLRARWPTLLSGVLAVAFYCLSWRSAIMGIAMVCAAALAADLVERDSGARGTTSMAVMIVGAALVLLPWAAMSPMGRRQVVELAVAAGLMAASAAVIELVSRRKVRLSVAAVAGVTGFACMGLVAWKVAGNEIQILLNESRRLFIGTSATYVSEAKALFAVDSPLGFLWREATISWIAALALIPWLIRNAVRERSRLQMMAVAWAVVTWTVMVLQVRFGYYAAAGIAIVIAAGLSRVRELRRGVADSVLLVLVVANLIVAYPEAKAYYALPDAHRQLFEFLGATSPEPFEEPNFLEEYTAQEPLPSYSVAAWWDEGYWISAIARRVPVANPTQEGSSDAARLLLAPDQEVADALAGSLRSRYLVVGEALAVLPPRPGQPATDGVFPALVDAIGEPLERYYELVELRRQGEAPREVYVFYPDYFRTLAIRLYLHQGQAVMNPEYWIGTFETTRDAEGNTKRSLVALERANSYVEAMNEQMRGDGVERRILSFDPMRTCIPLEELQGYRLIGYTGDAEGRGTGRPSLMLFERGVR